MASGKRIFLYSQHLTGTGHFVRTFEIARTLAERHEVYLADGGRRVPRPASGTPLTLVPIPAICRTDQGLVSLDSARRIDDVMIQRRMELLKAIEQIQPDLVMIEHFPFSKWELEQEVTAAIQRARSVNPFVRIVCSLRDVAPGTNCKPPRDLYRRHVLQTLQTHFDLILVHADPRLVRLEEHIPWAEEIDVPIEYTGYVSQRPSGRTNSLDQIKLAPIDRQRTVIVSAGGHDGTGLILRTLDAWSHLFARGAVVDDTLVIFLPLFPRPDELAALDRQTVGRRICVIPFTPDFLDCMQTADLSISHAGYNTCTNLLQTQIRSILIPNPGMSDQWPRAQRLAESGLALTLDPIGLTPDHLADAILERLNAPAPQHDINLNGASVTRQILERLCAGESFQRQGMAKAPSIHAA